MFLSYTLCGGVDNLINDRVNHNGLINIKIFFRRYLSPQKPKNLFVKLIENN